MNYRYIVPIMLLVALPAHAQTITIRNKGVTSQQINNLFQQVQDTVANGQVPGMTPEQQVKLQGGLALSQVYGCTEQSVGKSAADAFVNEMQAVGKQVEAYCKQGQPSLARALAIDTLKARQNDPVALAARRCYYESKPKFLTLINSYGAHDIANYERWVNDPSLADVESTEQDICKGEPNGARPAVTVTSQPIQDIQ